MSATLDLMITPIFWIVLAPGIYEGIKAAWPKYGIAVLPTAILMTTHHSVPLISTMINLYYTDIKLLKKDWLIMVFMGLAYIPCNYIGARTTGKPIYPYADWVNVPETFAIYVAAAFVEGGIFYVFASYTHRKQQK